MTDRPTDRASDRDADHAADQRTAIVTGASRGLGLALSRGLLGAGWRVVGDGRDAAALVAAADALGPAFTPVVGDVTDPGHRQRLVAAARATGRLDALVNNAGALGPSPRPRLADLDAADLDTLLQANVVAPAALTALALPDLRRTGGAVVHITSDAGVEAWVGWGAYGLTKAALEHHGRVLAVEEPDIHVWVVDPGDMRTAMHQAAFPGEDISDRPTPEASAAALADLLASDRSSGRVALADLTVAVSTLADTSTDDAAGRGAVA